MWTISQYLHYLSCNNRLLAEHWVETCSSILIWVRKWLSQCCLASFCSFYASCEGANCRSKNCCGANCLGANHWSASCCLTWKLTFMRDSCARACCRTSLIKRNRSLSGSSSRRYWNTILSWASTASALFRVAKGVCDANRVVFPFNVFCCNCKPSDRWIKVVSAILTIIRNTCWIMQHCQCSSVSVTGWKFYLRLNLRSTLLMWE